MKGIVLIIIVLSFVSCATMFHAREVQVLSASKANTPIQVIDDKDNVVYDGNLPARFKVKNGWGKSYRIVYTQEGKKIVAELGDKFNGFFIMSLFLGLIPAVVDLATGNVTHAGHKVTLP